LAAALEGAVSIAMDPGSNSIILTFGAADKNFDFLAAGETLTVVYNITVTDAAGVSLTQPVTITVTGTNDAPVLAADASGPHTITEAPNITGSSSPDTSFGTLTFTDVDLDDHHTVSASAPAFAWSGGTLTAAQKAALAAASTLTLSQPDSTGSGAGSIAFGYSAADKTFDFLAAGQTLTITYQVTVTDNNGVSSAQPLTITVTGDDEPPVLGNVAAIVSYSENSPPLTLSPAMEVSDPDNQTLQSATVSISGGFLAGDVLSADVTGTSITASYDAATGVLILTGNDTLAHYQQVLGSVAYNSTSANPTAFGVDTIRTISWAVNDGSLDSALQITTLNIAAVDDAPVATITQPSYSASEQTGLSLKGTGLSISDVDAGSGSMTVTLSVGEGTLSAT